MDVTIDKILGDWYTCVLLCDGGTVLHKNSSYGRTFRGMIIAFTTDIVDKNLPIIPCLLLRSNHERQ